MPPGPGSGAVGGFQLLPELREFPFFPTRGRGFRIRNFVFAIFRREIKRCPDGNGRIDLGVLSQDCFEFLAKGTCKFKDLASQVADHMRNLRLEFINAVHKGAVESCAKEPYGDLHSAVSWDRDNIVSVTNGTRISVGNLKVCN